MTIIIVTWLLPPLLLVKFICITWLSHDLQVDETDVEVVHTFNPSTQTVDDYKYPRPGSKNAPSKLRLLEFTVDEHRKVRRLFWTVSFKEVHCIMLFDRLQISSSRKSLPRRFSDYFPDCSEYLVRAGWTPDGSLVWFQLVDRVQKCLKVVFVQWEAFVDEADEFPREQVCGWGRVGMDYWTCSVSIPLFITLLVLGKCWHHCGGEHEQALYSSITWQCLLSCWHTVIILIHRTNEMSLGNYSQP